MCMALMAAISSGLLILFLAGLGIYFLPLRLDLSYHRQGGQHTARGGVTLGGHLHLAAGLLPAPPRPEPAAKRMLTEADSESAGLILALRTARRLERAWRRTVEKMSGHARFTRIEWTSTIGLSDAASTALSTGSLWALKGLFVGKWQHHMHPAVPTLHVNVTPNFTSCQSQTHFHCIAELRCGHIIKASCPLLGEFREN